MPGPVARWPIAAKPGSPGRSYLAPHQQRAEYNKREQTVNTTTTTTRPLVDSLIRAFNAHDAAAFAEHYTVDAVAVDPAYPEPLRGRAAIRDDMAAFFASFSDIKGTAVNVVVEGDNVVYEAVAEATHTGPVETPAGLIPATNRKVSLRFGIFMTVDGQGLVTSERRYYDLADQLVQLGVMQ